MSDAEKEQIKLRANYFNSLAVALVAVGGIAPALAISRSAVNWCEMVFPIAGFFTSLIFSLGLHFRACGYLKHLDK